jgi:hypothetical protein
VIGIAIFQDHEQADRALALRDSPDSTPVAALVLSRGEVFYD